MKGKASIVIASFNNKKVLKREIQALLKQSYSDFEVLVADDGSTDGTVEMLKAWKNSKLKSFFLKWNGPTTARNHAIARSKGEFVVILDHDCIPEKNWLKELLEVFEDSKIGGASSFSSYGGTSTAYRRKALFEAGLFSQEYNWPHFRDDVDLVFKVEELGYTFVQIKGKANFQHIHVFPKSFGKKIQYLWNRIWLHALDALLYKKHPEKAKQYLDVRLGFVRNPVKDFEVATGSWKNKFEASSPTGLKVLENKSFLHAIAIVLIGVLYVFLVGIARLYGSIKYGKLLI